MSGNKTDNGVHEVGTDEIRKAYQDDTPGQQVEKYLSQIKEVNEAVQKKHFSTKYPNPLKGFPYNESKLDEGKMGELFLDIQNGATAKDIAKNYPVSLQQAKEFLKDYYSQKKKPLKMGEESEEISEVFRPNPELRDVRKLDKMLESAYKSMNKLQNGKSLYLRKCNDGIVDARRALDEYVDAIESGKLD